MEAFSMHLARCIGVKSGTRAGTLGICCTICQVRVSRSQNFNLIVQMAMVDRRVCANQSFELRSVLTRFRIEPALNRLPA